MHDRPTGTVTFLFTDIQGSTRRWESHPKAMAGALARHDALLRAAVEAHAGHVFKTVGDAVCVSFQTAPQGLAAALDAQRALAAEDWATFGSRADTDAADVTIAPIMAKEPGELLQAVSEANLVLAARCAAQPEVIARVPADLLDTLRAALVARCVDVEADLRHRIACGHALGDLGDPRFERRDGPHGAYLLPPLVEIPGGRYPMGADAPIDLTAQGLSGSVTAHMPRHEVEIEGFRIGAFPVTNAEWACFLDAGGYDDDRWWDTAKAYPYGDAFDRSAGNTLQTRVKRSTPVGVFPTGRTPRGVANLSVNVVEWTSSLFGEGAYGTYETEHPYPYDAADGREHIEAASGVRRVVRGGGWSDPPTIARTAFRGAMPPDNQAIVGGLRVVVECRS